MSGIVVKRRSRIVLSSVLLRNLVIKRNGYEARQTLKEETKMPRFSLEVHDYVGDVNKVTETESRGISHFKRIEVLVGNFQKNHSEVSRSSFLGVA